MNQRYVLALLTLILIALPACADDPGEVLRGTVTWVHDGDTLEVENIGTIRLIGIDTPERTNSGRDWYLERQGISAAQQRQIYQTAKEFNIKHIKGESVTLSLDHPVRDRYSRLLAYVHLDDGRILNRVLLEKGLAVVYRKFSFKRKEEFLQAEEQARHAKIGLWEKTD